jgi:hypothetical protein
VIHIRTIKLDDDLKFGIGKEILFIVGKSFTIETSAHRFLFDGKYLLSSTEKIIKLKIYSTPEPNNIKLLILVIL